MQILKKGQSTNSNRSSKNGVRQNEPQVRARQGVFRRALEKRRAERLRLKEARANVDLRLVQRGDVFVSLDGTISKIIARMSFSKVSHNGIFVRDLKNHNEIKIVDYKLFQGGKVKDFKLLERGAKFKVLRWKNATKEQIEAFAYNSERIAQLRKKYDGYMVLFGYLPEIALSKLFRRKIEIITKGMRHLFTCSENFAYAAAPPAWAINELGLKSVKLLPEKYASHLDDIIPGTIEKELVEEGIMQVIHGASHWPNKN